MKRSFQWNTKLSTALSRGFHKGPVLRQRSTASFDSLSSAETRVETIVPSKEFSLHDSAEFDDTSSTISTSASRNQRRVKFLVDDDDDVITQVILFPKFRREDAANLYWSSDQRQDFVFNLKADADDMQLDHSCHIDQIEEIYANSLAQEVDSEEAKDGIRTIMQWSTKTEGRGLEGLVMNSLRQSRRRCIRNVLKLQQSFPDDINYEESSKQLRKRSRRYSRNAEEFSFLLALGDSAAADTSI